MSTFIVYCHGEPVHAEAVYLATTTAAGYPKLERVPIYYRCVGCDKILPWGAK